MFFFFSFNDKGMRRVKLQEEAIEQQRVAKFVLFRSLDSKMRDSRSRSM